MNTRIRHKMMPRTEKLLTSFSFNVYLVVMRESTKVRIVRVTAVRTSTRFHLLILIHLPLHPPHTH